MNGEQTKCWGESGEPRCEALHVVQDDGVERMRMRNKERTIKVNVKVKVNRKPDDD